MLRVRDASTFRGDVSENFRCAAPPDPATLFGWAGYRNVTASYGIEGFTEDHLAAFKRYGTERALLAYDRDDAGGKAAAALSEKLIAQGLECFRIHFPKGMDANEYALTVKPAEKSLGVLIRSAIWLGNGAASTPASQVTSSPGGALARSNNSPSLNASRSSRSSTPSSNVRN